MAPARPAEPLLASALVTDEELGELFGKIIARKTVPEKKEGALDTGSRSVDEALGGLEGGRVVGVWGEAGDGGAEICLALLASSLLKDPHSSTAVVDTTGNFDVLRLYSFILARLQDDLELLNAMRGAMGAGSVSAEDVAAKSLDRVNIMRAFDLVGVMEAVGEMRDELRGQHLEEKGDNAVKLSQGQRAELPSEAMPHEEILEPEENLPKRTFVADRDDEGEGMLFDDMPAASTPANHPPAEALPTEERDEILFVDGPADQRHNTSHPPPVATNPQVQRAESEHVQSAPNSIPTKPTFLLIDNLAHVISPLVQKNHAQGTCVIPILNNVKLTYYSTSPGLLLHAHPLSLNAEP
ncbi:uncharacterized protein N0V89_001508 [Didymosphaeria variabile]|uniref:DNA recombination and repair protein Rad51-like C-terminal domain-containing protein n=1 Tax=Didymosphaeria variabile TaxID=1932322 RepID=A0A9W8XWF2_9PLEO|nr:uncharacterized protein N0V89_001508 [Didymosphaeria variabile]KAJ4360939.1 hypothetical protein N0V89_001508 [Didymosphaeria variabile]